MKILVIDIGGSNIKLYPPDGEKIKVPSGDDLTPEVFREMISPLVQGFDFEAVSIGVPTLVRSGRILNEPTNLGTGWVGYNFTTFEERPVKIINDAAMQAYGGYQSGRMLFLGFGTGLGSAIVDDDVIIPLELCELRYSKKRSLEDAVGKKAYRKAGRGMWSKRVHKVIAMLKSAMLPDEILVGGGNAKRIDNLPDGVRVGGNSDALAGGIRLWKYHDFGK